MVGQLVRFLLFVVLMIALPGYASQYIGVTYSDPYGFWSIWPGLIAPFPPMGVFLSWLASLAGVDFLANANVIGLPSSDWTFDYIGFALALMTSAGAAQSRR